MYSLDQTVEGQQITMCPQMARGHQLIVSQLYMNRTMPPQKLVHKGKPQTQTLLATAVVELRNKLGQYVPCRVLLDSASQCHFITEKCVQRLRLSKTQTRSSIQGINHSSAAATHCVSVHMRSRHTDWHDSLNLQYYLTSQVQHLPQNWTQVNGNFPLTLN